MKQYEKSITSQWGEDGVIEEIFNRIGTNNKIAVDIGAWDGKHLSNTWALGQKGWKRILAEKDDSLRRQAYQDGSVLNTFGEVTSIDSMLSGITCPIDFDFLTIDIDGDDYWLWYDMVKYKPRVICIEYNQTVPIHLDIKQERGGTFGASWLAMRDLGIQKGYICVYTTITNMIFIHNNEYSKPDGMLHTNKDNYIPFAVDYNQPPKEWQPVIIQGYNGKLYIAGTPHNDDQGGKHEKLISDVKITPI